MDKIERLRALENDIEATDRLVAKSRKLNQDIMYGRVFIKHRDTILSLIAELGQEVGADCPLCGGRDCGCGDECEDRKAYGYDIPRAHVEPVAGTAEKIEAARDWIEKTPHGDNCYLDPDHAYGNSCYCGKESILDALNSPAHTSEARDATRSEAYAKVDRFLRNTLMDAAYAEYSDALEIACGYQDAAMRQEGGAP